VVLGVLGDVLGQVELRLAHPGFRIAEYGSQPGGLGVAGQVQGPWGACDSELCAALSVAVEALRQWQLGDRRRQQRRLPAWSPRVERDGRSVDTEATPQ